MSRNRTCTSTLLFVVVDDDGDDGDDDGDDGDYDGDDVDDEMDGVVVRVHE